MSRYRFFLMAFAASFCWYWLPDLIFPALGYFTWVCWIAPNNAVVNQVFGMNSGIGLLPITFDWSQIAYIGSPLVVPTWAILNVLASLVVWIYIVSPALYYSNVWDSAYYPIQSNSIFDKFGEEFNVSRVINKLEGFSFNETAYREYSDVRNTHPSPSKPNTLTFFLILTDLPPYYLCTQYVWPMLCIHRVAFRMAGTREAG